MKMVNKGSISILVNGGGSMDSYPEHSQYLYSVHRERKNTIRLKECTAYDANLQYKRNKWIS